MLSKSASVSSSSSSSSSSASEPPPLSLQTTTVNFRKFVQKCGFIFVIQDFVENIITWKNPSNTLLAMVIYINVCLYPQLLIILPLAGFLMALIYFYQKKFPNGPPLQYDDNIINRSTKSKTRRFKKLKYTNLVLPAAENSVDYLKNLQNIQNLMGMISDGYDAVLPLIKYIDWSDEVLTLKITQVVVISLVILSLVSWIIPWSYVFIIGGIGVFIANTQFVKALTKESAPFVLEKGNLLMMKLIDYFEEQNDDDDDDDDNNGDDGDNVNDSDGEDEVENQTEVDYINVGYISVDNNNNNNNNNYNKGVQPVELKMKQKCSSNNEDNTRSDLGIGSSNLKNSNL